MEYKDLDEANEEIKNLILDIENTLHEPYELKDASRNGCLFGLMLGFIIGVYAYWPLAHLCSQ